MISTTGLEMLLSGSFYNSQGAQPFCSFRSSTAPPRISELRKMRTETRPTAHSPTSSTRISTHHAVVEASRTKQIPTASFGTVFNDPRTQTTDAHAYVDAQYRHVFGTWETLGRISYDWYGYNGTYIYDYAQTGIPRHLRVNKDLANGDWVDLQWDASHLFFKRHSVTLGSEFRQDIRQQQSNYDVQPFFSYLNDHRSERVWALYLQDEFRVHGKLAFCRRAAQRLVPEIREIHSARG